MIRRILQNLQQGSLAGLLTEIIVVIVSILIAFQIDNWANEREDRRQEQLYLQRLADDLRNELDRMDDAIRYAQDRVEAVELLERVAASPDSPPAEPEQIAIAIEKVTWRSYPQITSYIYTELLSTGKLSLILSDQFRLDLARHYMAMQHNARVGLDRDLHRQFDRATAGILTSRELMSIESNNLEELDRAIDENRGREIAMEFAANSEAIRLLPNIAQHNVFNHRVVDASRKRTQRLIDDIEAMLY